MIIHYRIIRSFLPIYTIPIFISVFSRESSKIRFAFALSLLSFYIQNYFFGKLDFDIVSVITFSAILFSAYVLGIEIIKRYEEINEDLKVAISNEKELFYKTIYMEKLSKTDLATGLYNHKTFHEYLDKLLSHFEEEKFELHLALFDLDRFKSVNDTYGHEVGDVVIVDSSKIIKECISSNDFAARYGGEEFAVIFTEKNGDEVKKIIEIIRGKIENHRYKEMFYNNVTVSIGFVSAVECSEKDEMFKMADRRLYKAKLEGRNQIVYYD
jgi:diguanylate cyclase (GGDEF)-like protein